MFRLRTVAVPCELLSLGTSTCSLTFGVINPSVLFDYMRAGFDAPDAPQAANPATAGCCDPPRYDCLDLCMAYRPLPTVL